MPVLNLVEDEQHLVLVANPAERLEPLTAEMAVTAFALDRLDDEGADSVGSGGDGGHDLGLGGLLMGDDLLGALRLGQREVDPGVGDAGPVEPGKVADLVGVGVRQGQGVAGPTMEGVAEVEDFGADFSAAGGQVLANLPVHGGLERVFDGEGAALDEEVSRQFGEADDAGEGVNEAGVLGRVDVGVGDLEQGGIEQVLADVGPVEVGVVEADGYGGIETVQVEEGTVVVGVVESAASAAGRVEHQFEAVEQDVLLEIGQNAGRIDFGLVVCGRVHGLAS